MMSRRPHILLRIALLTALFALGAFAEDRYLVKVTGDVNGIAKRYGLSVVKSLTGSAAGQHVLASTGADPQTMLRNLLSEFAVNRAEVEQPVRLPGIQAAGAVHPASAPAAASSISSTLIRYYGSYAASAYVNQPATDVINMDLAHTLATGKGIVATIDTGADFSHSVLRSSLTWGWDFVHGWPLGQEQADVNQETTPILDQETTPILDGTKYPAFGHGTMVAGLIHLVAPDAKIMPLRAFGADGSASISQIVQAIYFAVDRGVNVINMSFSVKQDSPTLKAVLDYAVSKGVICVASAGNDGQPIQVWPAAYSDVIGVASTNNQKIRSLFSNFGNSLVSVAAPGEGVITTYPQEHYAQVWGTSFSAPLVSGGASLLLDMNNKTNEAMAVSDLSHAAAIGQQLGAGELDLYQACLAAKK
jgi:subtilisin family serine protease